MLPLRAARLEEMLREEAPYGDITTLGLGIGDAVGQVQLCAGRTMTLCCSEEAERLFLLAGCSAVHRVAASGALLDQGGPILTATGPAAALHQATRVAQALMATTSGIATQAARIRAVARREKPGIAVACPREHLPGARDVMLRAIAAGGCVPHRLGLSDSILVGAPHRAFLGREPAYRWVARLRAAQPERSIAVEAGTVDEAVLLAHAGVDIVQCGGLSPAQLAEVTRALADHPRRPVIAAAGGVTEGNAADYARADADLLITASPYSAPPLEITARMERL
ncbi:ModD protein [Roseomonas sp. KE0001]|uniref:ModD protein n=1 Tax=unclassified Roseomonas TaxID=2617492 RepID=UPI0018DFD463|nr:ModD protein [Roseomonas sp. KE0001]MBI0434642.1 ModD protein [Roseomonas sp. KE0001]